MVVESVGIVRSGRPRGRRTFSGRKCSVALGLWKGEAASDTGEPVKVCGNPKE